MQIDAASDTTNDSVGRSNLAARKTPLPYFSENSVS